MIEWPALWLSLRLAAVTTGLLLVLCTPLAWWLARARHRGGAVIDALVTLPLVLPPTVMGFYLLLLLGPNGWLGGAWMQLTDGALSFRFAGLVIASLVYSLPFVLQPIQQAFAGIDRAVLETAETLGAGLGRRFFHLILPLAQRGYLNAAVMGFAHTLGEFGIVLMVGGNIPGETRVISIAIYDQVESLDYAAAHAHSALLLTLAFVLLLSLHWINRRAEARGAV